jgi:hypothetical protein
MDCTWKANWEETKRRLGAWWAGEGLAIGAWSYPRAREPREPVADPGMPGSIEGRFTDPEWRALSNHWGMARGIFPADVLPLANCDTGPGSLALYMGSEPGFDERTVWFNPTMADDERPEDRPLLRFDPESRWWKIAEQTLVRSAELARGKYMVGCPDLIENLDILASLRGTERMLTDMVERPEWVEQKMREINAAWFEAFDRIYDIIRLEDGSNAFAAFAIWGPGRTAKLQCDASAMISPAMFERFVVPVLSEQCDRLDYTIFHLDGHQCIPHLDLLLGIESLGAIEWTTDPQVPGGGDPEWYPMYRRILDAGKSVQAIGVTHEQIEPLLDAVGGAGLYILTEIRGEADAGKLLRIVEPYR